MGGLSWKLVTIIQYIIVDLHENKREESWLSLRLQETNEISNHSNFGVTNQEITTEEHDKDSAYGCLTWVVGFEELHITDCIVTFINFATSN